jgi:Protein of unknown function DUF262
MKLLQQEVENNRKNIRHEALTFSLSELVNIHRDEEILIRPDFQRLFRWTRVQQTSFIESLLLEIPIPPLFFFEKNDGKWELLDGLQRLSTIIRFIGTGQDVCGGQVKTDTELSFPGQPLEVIGTNIPQIRM